MKDAADEPNEQHDLNSKKQTQPGEEKYTLASGQAKQSKTRNSSFSSIYPHLYCTDLLENREDVKNPSMTGMAAVLKC